MHTATLNRPAPTGAFLLAGWFVVAASAGAAGLVSSYPLPIPSLVLLLTATLLVTLRRSSSLRAQVRALGAVPLVALHLTRFVGAAFLVLSARGELPAEWAVPVGVGDLAVAVATILLLTFAAPFRTAGQRRALLAWNVFGLADMVMVIAGAIRMVIADPSAGAVMTRLPLSLLPTFLVPLIITSHVMLFVWLRQAGTADSKQ
jgi:hypothetical protein